MLAKIGFAGLIEVAQVKKHGQGGFAVLFVNQKGQEIKHETWVCFSKLYLKYGKLDKTRFRQWGVFRSPGWFKDTAPGTPTFLIASELADVLEKQLKTIF